MRGNFSNRLGFIAAAAGSAVGLGNIWGFPYEVGQGGGAAFVFVYLFFCFTLCLPVMLIEVAMGRKAQKNAVGTFDKLGHKKWNFVGKLGVLSGILILSFYNVIAGWSFGYILELSTGNFAIGKHFQDYTSDVLRVGSYGLVFMAATAFIVSKGVANGIEKVAKFLMPLLILMILGVAIYSVTLPHADKGLSFFLVPDFTRLTGPVIFNAMGQAFFSLSLGMGALITYGSYVGKKENLISSTILITLVDVTIAIMAGFMIFPLLGFLTDGNMDQIKKGPELIFITLPAVFENIGGTHGAILGASFFLLLCFAALTSTVSLLEVPVAYLVDEFNLKRNKTVWLVSFGIFLLGIPSLLGNGYSKFFTHFITYHGSETSTNFLTFILNLANDTFLPLGGCLIVIFAIHIWKKESLDQEISSGSPNYQGSFFQKYMHISTAYAIPMVLAIIFIATIYRTFF